MHVLVATRQTQGQRDDDFSWTVEGELVRLPGMHCDCPGCGCDRAMAGLSSSRATTTVQVIDRADVDVGAFRSVLHDALVREGWVTPGDAEGEAMAVAWADEHLQAAARFHPGTVLELRDGHLVVRRTARSHGP
jgi:hypothetical protein